MKIMEEIRFQEKIKAIQDTMYVLGGKWKIPIIISIYRGNNRFTEILNSIPDLSNRVLSKELKHLELNLLITKNKIDEYPTRIEYSLTDYCMSIDSMAKPMEEWGRNHLKMLRKL